MLLGVSRVGSGVSGDVSDGVGGCVGEGVGRVDVGAAIGDVVGADASADVIAVECFDPSSWRNNCGRWRWGCSRCSGLASIWSGEALALSSSLEKPMDMREASSPSEGCPTGLIEDFK